MLFYLVLKKINSKKGIISVVGLCWFTTSKELKKIFNLFVLKCIKNL